MAITLHATAQVANKINDNALHTGYDVMKDTETEQTIFKGQIGFADLAHEKSFDWFEKGVKEYNPSAKETDYLKQRLPGYHLVIFMGTWCDDSHNLIPKLYKTLQEIHYSNTYMMYGTDRAKTTGAGAAVPRDRTAIIVCALVYAAFVATLGRGIAG